MKAKAEKLYTYFAAAICLFIPFMTHAKAFVNVLMIGLVLLLFMLPQRASVINFFKQNYFRCLIAFLLFVIISSAFKYSFLDDFSETRKIAQTLLLIILFSIVKTKGILIASFISGTVISTLLTLINFVILYLKPDLLIAFNIGDSFITQRLYLGYFLVVSLILSLERFYSISVKKQKRVYLLLISFLLFSLFLISSRSAILIALIVLISSLIYSSKSKYKLILALIVTFMFSLIITNSKSLSERFLYSDDSIRASFIDKIKIHEPRYDIWKFSFQIFKMHPSLFGIGSFKTQEFLIEKYKAMPIKKRRDWFLERNFNTHNQYIDLILSYGLIGFLIFVLFLKEIFSKVYKNTHSFNLIISLALFLFIENIFHRQLGAFIFALIVVWSIDLTNRKNEKNINS